MTSEQLSKLGSQHIYTRDNREWKDQERISTLAFPNKSTEWGKDVAGFYARCILRSPYWHTECQQSHDI